MNARSASSNRQAMPTVAQMVDDIRAMGIEVRVIYAAEKGKELGKKPEGENAFDIPRNYCKPSGGWK